MASSANLRIGPGRASASRTVRQLKLLAGKKMEYTHRAKKCLPSSSGSHIPRISATVVGLSHEKPGHPGWVRLLVQELRTARLPRPHVLVGYQWSHTGLRPGRKTSHSRYIRSFVSHPPQIRACTSRAPGSSSHEFATRAIRRRYVDRFRSRCTCQVSLKRPRRGQTAASVGSDHVQV